MNFYNVKLLHCIPLPLSRDAIINNGECALKAFKSYYMALYYGAPAVT